MQPCDCSKHDHDEQNAGEINARHEQAERLERVGTEGAHRKRHRSERGHWRGTRDDAHDAEENFRHIMDERSDGAPALAKLRECDSEKNGGEKNL